MIKYALLTSVVPKNLESADETFIMKYAGLKMILNVSPKPVFY